MKAKLKFLEFVSNKLNKFLRGYETDQPMVLKLMKVDANDVNLHKPYDLIQISSMLSITRKATDFTESTLLRFYKEVSMYVACFFNKPFHGKILFKASHCLLLVLSCFNPIVLNDTKKHAVSKKQLHATGGFKSKNAGGTSPKIQRRVC